MKRIVIILLLGVSVVFGESTKIKKEIKKENLSDIIKIDTVKKGLNENKEGNIYIYEKKDNTIWIERYPVTTNFIIAIILMLGTYGLQRLNEKKRKNEIEKDTKKQTLYNEKKEKHKNLKDNTIKLLAYQKALMADYFNKLALGALVYKVKLKPMKKSTILRMKINIIVQNDKVYTKYNELLEEIDVIFSKINNTNMFREQRKRLDEKIEKIYEELNKIEESIK